MASIRKASLTKDDAYCTCIWGSLHRENFKNGGKLCKHLTTAIKVNQAKRKKKNYTFIKWPHLNAKNGWIAEHRLITPNSSTFLWKATSAL